MDDFVENAQLKMRSLPPARTLARMPLRICSHTAGTPHMSVGLNARMSPTQLRTELSVKVLEGEKIGEYGYEQSV